MQLAELGGRTLEGRNVVLPPIDLRKQRVRLQRLRLGYEKRLKGRKGLVQFSLLHLLRRLDDGGVGSPTDFSFNGGIGFLFKARISKARRDKSPAQETTDVGPVGDA